MTFFGKHSTKLFFLSLVLLIFSPAAASLDTPPELDKYVLRTWTIQSGLPQNTITALAQTREGYIWIGTSAGLVRFDGVKFKTFSKENSPLLHNKITSLFEDSIQVLWIGTDGGGLYSYANGIWKNYDTEDGLSNPNIRTIMGDWKGYLWVGTDYGLNRLDSDIIQIYTTENGLSNNIITDLTLDIWGNLWIGSLQGGLTKHLKNAFITYDYDEGLTNTSVLSLKTDRLGNIWIGTDDGLNRYRNGKIEVSEKPTGSTKYSIQVLLESRRGFLYAGTNEGLFRVSQGSTEKLNLSDSNSQLDIAALYEDIEGVLWIGTNGSGLLRWKEANTTAFSTKHGLRDDFIFSIIEDKNGKLWMSSNKGVFCINKKDIDDFADGKKDYVFSTFFDETDGMSGSQCLGEGQPSGWKTFSGQFLYPTGQGAILLDPENISFETDPPVVVITEVLTNNSSTADKIDSARYHKKEIFEIHFTAFDFSAPEKLQFFYKLEGYDLEFIHHPHGAERFARYMNLDPGEYRFLVKAVNNNGIWNKKQTLFEFEILLPFSQTPLFYTIIALLILSAGGILLYTNKQKKIQKSKDKYKTLAIDPDRIEEVLQKLTGLMEKEKLFLDPNLTLNKLAKRLNIHYNHLSRIINERMELSYNDFINKYRIREAQKKLTDFKNKDSTVLEILLSTGFYSKSVFNTAFKKFTGQTPSEYRKKNLKRK